MENFKTMNNFLAVYRILNFIKKSERYDKFDGDNFNNEYFGLTERQWMNTIERIADDGYVKRLSVEIAEDGCVTLNLSNPAITTKGLEYLADKAYMQSESAKPVVSHKI